MTITMEFKEYEKLLAAQAELELRFKAAWHLLTSEMAKCGQHAGDAYAAIRSEAARIEEEGF